VELLARRQGHRVLAPLGVGQLDPVALTQQSTAASGAQRKVGGLGLSGWFWALVDGHGGQGYRGPGQRMARRRVVVQPCRP